ncbi:FHA domain-containing protein [Haloimpatiens sp. FM7330]|uniref:FHA domain-containing protein n=1 Tax=Haloimpatiens sp. FM7330 TaxID=3298610 RepID=UPI00363BF5A9
MDLNKLSFISKIFTIIIIVVIYIIIALILKIMYKDIKNSGKKRRKKRKKYGLEILQIEGNSNFKVGSVVPISSVITIGRKEDNFLILYDNYVSSYHARIGVKNNNCVLQDLNSTNGTFINDEKINGEVYLSPGDIIQVGKSTFKMIG